LALRDRRLSGVKFRRQHPIGPYFADFCSTERRLVIELDGSQHVEQAEYDRQRTVFMELNGYTVLRFWDHEVLVNAAAVMEDIFEALRTSPLTPALSPDGGEGAGKGRSPFTPVLSPDGGEGAGSR
jgi:adenine-specific DNA-methyltransferase